MHHLILLLYSPSVTPSTLVSPPLPSSHLACLQTDDRDIAEMMISMHADNPELGPGSFSHIGSNPFINPNRYGTYQSSLNNRDDPYQRDSVTLLEDGRDDTSAWAKKFNSAGASAHTQVTFLLDLKFF
jgi:hypothetical protein